MAQREALSQVRISVRNLVEFVMRLQVIWMTAGWQERKRRLCRPEAVCTGRSRGEWDRVIRQR